MKLVPRLKFYTGQRSEARGVGPVNSWLEKCGGLAFFIDWLSTVINILFKMKSLSLPCDHDNVFYRLVLLEVFGCSVLCESWWEEFSACLSLLGCLLECSSLDVSLSGGFELLFLSWQAKNPYMRLVINVLLQKKSLCLACDHDDVFHCHVNF